jgi:hypothetical protein
MCSTRIWGPVNRRMVGAIGAPGKRPVTAVLRAVGTRDDRPFPPDHRVLSRAPWPAPRGGRMLLRWRWRAVVPTGAVGLGIDATSARQRGAKMAAKGGYRDLGRSSQAPVVKQSRFGLTL